MFREHLSLLSFVELTISQINSTQLSVVYTLYGSQDHNRNLATDNLTLVEKGRQDKRTNRYVCDLYLIGGARDKTSEYVDPGKMSLSKQEVALGIALLKVGF